MTAQCEACAARRSLIASGEWSRYAEPLCYLCLFARQREWMASPASKPQQETRLEQSHRELDDLAEYLVALDGVAEAARTIVSMTPGLTRMHGDHNDLRRALKRLDAAT